MSLVEISLAICILGLILIGVMGSLSMGFMAMAKKNNSDQLANQFFARRTGCLDDNGDGLKDGSDGGAYSGYAIVNQGNIRGMGALAKNQHTYQGPLPMPNLSSLSWYE
jgi:hypothetical protein